MQGGALMKQRDLIKKLEKAGFRFARHGGNHDICEGKWWGTDTKA